MIKNLFYLIVLAIIAVPLVIFFDSSKNSPNILEVDNTALSAPSLAMPSSSPTVLAATTTDNSDEWKKYDDKSLGISLSYPKNFSLKKEADIITIYKTDNAKQISLISIREREIKDTETVNTISEKDINQKLEKYPDKVTVSETITPIAIGSITAITFKLLEQAGENTYFYIPKGKNNFLEISTIGENNLSRDEISLVDRVVYSLEIK